MCFEIDKGGKMVRFKYEKVSFITKTYDFIMQNIRIYTQKAHKSTHKKLQKDT